MSLSILQLASTMMAGPPNHVAIADRVTDWLAQSEERAHLERRATVNPRTRPRVEAAHRIDAALPTLSPST
jgi:hypothetical protein